MRSKILIACMLAAALSIGSNVYAANQGLGSPVTSQVQQQPQAPVEEEVQQAKQQVPMPVLNEASQNRQETQTANQGESGQIQTQNSEQAQNSDSMPLLGAGSGTQAQTQQQVQQRMQDGSGDGNQVQNQNQINNRGEADKIKNKEQSGAQNHAKPGFANAQERRSRVANAVQAMLQVADRTGGVGQQIRIIAQSQNQNQENIEASMQKIEKRSGFTKFLIGPNYGEIRKAKKSLDQNRGQIMQLNQILNQISSPVEQQQLMEQIELLEQANSDIENSLSTSLRGFSLLGWVFRMFA